MFSKILIANRGVIACRILRTLRRMGVKAVAVYSEADRHSPHVLMADEAVLLGPALAAQSYLVVEKVIEAALQTGAEAIHPGYGFLSENAGFAEACELAGIAFIGPTPEQMRLFGLKHTSREIAQQKGVPLLEGTGVLASLEQALHAATRIGYPVMLKSSAGGGGIGMRLCETPETLSEAYEAVKRMSAASFGNSSVFLERAVTRARHIEVQIFGDGNGRVLTLGERDCSAQRRNQKVIEETPTPNISEGVRQQLFDAARRLGEAVSYRSAGTVEFLYDAARGDFAFLEVNTRLQVEHGVTEEVTGIDLVEWMVRLAAGEGIPQFVPEPSGHSIQARLYAEDPYKAFAPSAGRMTEVAFPDGARVESWVEPGCEVSPYYDPMLAKVIVKGATRQEAVGKLADALAATRMSGIETNLGFLRQIVAEPAFQRGAIDTSFLGTIRYQPAAMDVIEPGTQTSVQDYPGRLGYWHVGVPPSGPMDGLSFRMANRIVGNAENAAGLEIAMTGPSLRFRSAALMALTGADFKATVDGQAVARYEPIPVSAGATLVLGTPPVEGARAYLAVRGGIEAPVHLGSRSTFILGGFGGPLGRALRAGDVLHVGTAGAHEASPARHVPIFTNEWTVGVLCGPHGAPDYFTVEDIDTFFASEWTVHYNSDRTGVRLVGPKPNWARKDGGEAGLHPSNIHDNAYAIGAVDFTGDMPVILGPDGPSLGGFVCPATIVTAELWKIGQLRPGDKVRFHPLTLEEAERMEWTLDAALVDLRGPLPELPVPVREPEVVSQGPGMVCRAAGDRNLLIEYGPNVLDINLRFRVHALELKLRQCGLPGILDVTPGIRSLQIHYDARRLHRETLLEAVAGADAELTNLEEIEVPSRVVHLPLSWDDPATRLAIEKYMQSVRPDAPWCPSNIEFIRRINGLGSIDDVYNTVFDARYLVMGLGDVYLGAPVATPVDPRHRLVTTKYNPARTWTPENAVGIGGAYLCVYGMEGPGGYQFVGRTVQMWNTWRTTQDFAAGSPWLLRFFDQIRFYPVGGKELLEIRDGFKHGAYPLHVEEERFSLAPYNRFLAEIGPSAREFKRRQQGAFDAERERWVANGQADFAAPETPVIRGGADEVPPGCQPVRAPVTANVWSIAVETGQRVKAGERLVVLEAMKMEVAVAAPRAGVVELLRCSVGTMVMGGQHLLHIRVDT
jgi:urea carboxylase